MKNFMLNHISRVFSRHQLARELGLALTVKFTLIMLASIFLFGADHRTHVDQDVMTWHVLDQVTSATEPAR